MRNRLTLILALMCSPALAQPVRSLQLQTCSDGVVRWVDADPGSFTSRTPYARLWDNWTPPEEGGRTNITGTHLIGEHEVGAVCHGVLGLGGWAAGVAFSLFNGSSTQSILQARATTSIYTPSGQLIATVSVFAPFLRPFPPGQRATYSFGDGSLLARRIRVPEDFILTFQWTELGNFDSSNLGMLVGSPLTTGTAPPGYFDRTTGTFESLGDADTRPLLYIHTDPIPTPSALAALLLGIPFTTRRKRSRHGSYSTGTAWAQS